VNFSTTSPTSPASWPTSLAQREGDRRREADQADDDHYNDNTRIIPAAATGSGASKIFSLMRDASYAERDELLLKKAARRAQ
jgi:hypothetical protein